MFCSYMTGVSAPKLCATENTSLPTHSQDNQDLNTVASGDRDLGNMKYHPIIDHRSAGFIGPLKRPSSVLID